MKVAVPKEIKHNAAGVGSFDGSKLSQRTRAGVLARG